LAAAVKDHPVVAAPAALRKHAAAQAAVHCCSSQHDDDHQQQLNTAQVQASKTCWTAQQDMATQTG
jgi:azurin